MSEKLTKEEKEIIAKAISSGYCSSYPISPRDNLSGAKAFLLKNIINNLQSGTDQEVRTDL